MTCPQGSSVNIPIARDMRIQQKQNKTIIFSERVTKQSDSESGRSSEDDEVADISPPLGMRLKGGGVR